MRSIFSLCSMGLIYIIYFVQHDARAQYFQQPWKYFENMTMDMENRGTYNVTFCIEELINCWEVVKPELICAYVYYYGAICSIMRDTCTDYYGLQENYHKFAIAEGWCYNIHQLFMT